MEIATSFLRFLCKVVVVGGATGLVLYVACMRRQYHERRKRARRWSV